MSKPRLTGMKVNPDDIEFESMIFYITWYEQLLDMEETMGMEIFNRGVKQLFDYSFHGIIPDNSDNPVLRMFFNMARASADANIKLRMAGRKGNETKRNNKAFEDPEEKKPRGRKKKEEAKEEPKPKVKRVEDMTPEELTAAGMEGVDEDGCYIPNPHNVAVLEALEKAWKESQ